VTPIGCVGSRRAGTVRVRSGVQNTFDPSWSSRTSLLRDQLPRLRIVRLLRQKNVFRFRERAARLPLSRVQIRSPFASRNANASSGNAGRPELAPDRECQGRAERQRQQQHVNRGRNSHWTEARGRARREEIGRPRLAADVSRESPKANEKFVKTFRCSLTITFFVGPRHTEYASTRG